MRLVRFAIFAALGLGRAFAADAEVRITISDHRFEPAEVRIPADKKVKLLVQNLDAAAEEFESHDLNREKLIPGKSTASIYIGPLSPGRYLFVGEFHEQTAKGAVIVE